MLNARVLTGTLALALAATATAARAQDVSTQAEVTFAGNATGAFSGGTAAQTSALTYTGSTFNDQTSGGFLAFGDRPGSGANGTNFNNFGSFTLNNANTVFSENFALLLTFAQPTGVQGGQTQTFTSTVVGNVTSDGRGGAFINFAAANNPRTLTFNGGTFTLSVNSVSLNAPAAGQTSTIALSGNILATATAVPEPSTYALLATGFVGLAGAVVRRRRTAA